MDKLVVSNKLRDLHTVKFLLEGIVHFICKTVLLFPPSYLVPNEISMYVLSQGILVSL